MIYLDYNATTPLCAAARAAMEPYFEEKFGNPSSVHRAGRETRAALDDARDRLAALFGAKPHEIIFTSGGTEADNFALRGAAEALEPTGRRHLIATGIEHEAVLNTLKALARRGWKTTILPVDRSGVVSPEALEQALTDDTALVSVLGVTQDCLIELD